MNLNILSYTLYIAITIYIIVWVGNQFHSNGRIFIIKMFRNHTATADTTNNLLLLAYYLFNIGYAVLQLHSWEPVTSIALLFETISFTAGKLILILALTHYFNILLIYFYSKKSFITQ